MDARLGLLDDPTSQMSQIWNREHDQYVLRQLLALAEPHFEWDSEHNQSLLAKMPKIYMLYSQMAVYNSCHGILRPT